MDKMRPWPRSIFSYGSPKLLDLLEVFLDSGWHPNQVLGSGQPKVVVHYVRCVTDVSILHSLLEHGADPTIASRTYLSLFFHFFTGEAPVESKSGHVLIMRVTEVSPEVTDLLLSHGAKLEDRR